MKNALSGAAVTRRLTQAVGIIKVNEPQTIKLESWMRPEGNFDKKCHQLGWFWADLVLELSAKFEF